MSMINGRLAEFKSCELLGPTAQKNEPTREARANVTFCPMVDIPKTLDLILKARSLNKHVFQFPHVCVSMDIGISASKWPSDV